jgi:hypothetical protein
MTPKLPNKLEPLTPPDKASTALESDRRIVEALNRFAASVNELRDFVEFGTRFIEELHNAKEPHDYKEYDVGTIPAESLNDAFLNPKERYQENGLSTASEPRDNKDIKGGK